jgi:hypothetical protein
MGLSMTRVVSQRSTNKDVQYNTRLTQFTTPPIQTGDLNVLRDLSVGRNTNLNHLHIRGDLDVSGNILCDGTIYARQYLPGQVVNTVMLSNTDLEQAVNNEYNNAFVISPDNTNTLFTYSYTPVIANSYLVVEYQTIYSLVGASSDSIQAYLNVYDSYDNRISQTYQQWNNGAGGGTRSGTIFPILGRYTNYNTDTKTIRVDVYNSTDSDNLTINSDISTWLKITEIGR